MTTKNYLINNLESELSLKSGYLNIKPKAFAEIQVWDLENESIKYAIGRKWADLTHTEPTTSGTVTGEIKLEIAEPYKGMTFEELQVEQAEKAKAKQDKEDVEQAKEDAAQVTPEPEPATIQEVTLPVQPEPEVAHTTKSKKAK